jgi:integrase
MARTPTIWLRSQDDHFYTTVRGNKIKLSPDKKVATRLLHELLAKQEEPAGSNISPSFRKIADLFLDDSEKHKKPATCRVAKFFLQSFCDHVGKRRVADLKVLHATEWVNANNWNTSTACSGRSTVLACLNWAVTQGYIDSHPLTKLKRGTHKRRERILSAEERQLIRDNVKTDFADFLLAMELTGARPFSELATLRAEMIDWKTKTIPLAEHKNEKKGKTRTIYITPKLADLLKRKCEEYPTGHLFRNRTGGAWTSHDATRRLHLVTDKLKLQRATIYAFRHSYCTDALAKGISANVLAELVGNSAVTIARNYDHLSKKRESMLAAAADAAA